MTPLARIVIFVMLFAVSKTRETAKCTLPSGGKGTCVKVSECLPVNLWYRKRHGTTQAKLYIRQSACHTSKTRVRMNRYGSYLAIDTAELGGHRGLSMNLPYSRIKIRSNSGMCCPPIDTWGNFEPKPYISEKPKPTSDEDESLEDSPHSHEDLREASKKHKYEKNIHTDICGFDSSTANKITGGEPTNVEQYPWLVLLQFAGNYLNCGGSLVTSKLVLTAAHCLYTSIGPPLFARLGEYNISSYPTDLVPAQGGGYELLNVTVIPIEKTYAHSRFMREHVFHDIGLAKLKRHAPFSDFIKIICLPTTNFVSKFTADTRFTVAGWGEDYNGKDFSDVKKDVHVPFVPMEKCKTLIRRPLLENFQICAGGEEGKDTCKGDSGGPLMYRFGGLFYAAGVVSYGPRNCGERGHPAVYTNVYKYISWIKAVIRSR